MSGNLDRRQAIQLGSLGLFGLTMGDVATLCAQDKGRDSGQQNKSVLMIYLPGGFSHIDTFDPKPQASDETRGEFTTIATRTAGVRICEHLPLLAARSNQWSLVRSLGHSTNHHTQAQHNMRCGKMLLPQSM